MIFSSKMKKFLVPTALFFLMFSFALPVFVRAQTTDTSPAKTGITYDCANENGGGKPGDCTFNDLIKAVKRVVDFAIELGLIFSVIVIAIAGYRYMISGDNTAERTKANKMLWSAAKGIVFILAAWLIVNLIMSTLVTSQIPRYISN